MNSDADLLREEPPGYGGASRPSAIAAYRPALNYGHVKLNWNKLHVLARQEICWGACVSEKIADKSWEELDKWLQILLEYSTELRSKGKILLCG